MGIALLYGPAALVMEAQAECVRTILAHTQARQAAIEQTLTDLPSTPLRIDEWAAALSTLADDAEAWGSDPAAVHPHPPSLCSVPVELLAKTDAIYELYADVDEEDWLMAFEAQVAHLPLAPLLRGFARQECIMFSLLTYGEPHCPAEGWLFTDWACEIQVHESLSLVLRTVARSRV